jgi:hypothetical protein
VPKLLINEGGQASVFELFDDEATIGRGASNAIQIVDSHASKHHAVIRRAGGRVKLVDLESKNGTRVNGEFRNQRWLQHGDAVSIGAAVLTYDGSDSTAVEEAPAPAAAAAFVGAGGGGVAAPTSRANAPRTRRERERDDEDDDRPRRPARRQTNNSSTVLLVGGGMLLVVVLFFLLLSGKGNPPNTMALRMARDLSMRGGATTEEAKANVQAALDYLTQHGDPSDADTYVSVAKEIEGLKAKLLSFDETDVEVAANHEYKLIENAFIELWKNGRTQESIGQDLIKWAAKYKGSRALGAFEAGFKDKKLLAVYKKTKEGGFAPPK